MRRPVTHLPLLVAAATMATGCVPVRHNLPPEQRLMEPGPGVGGPGPGVLGPVPVQPGPGMMPGMMPGGYPMGMMSGDGPEGAFAGGPRGGEIAQAGFGGQPGGLMTADGNCPNGDCGPGGLMGMRGLVNGGSIPPGGGVLPSGMMPGGMMVPAVPPAVQVTFGMPESMQVRYDATGSGGFDSEPLVVPARQNFPQGGLYRVKITNIRGREGVELYPTIELAHANPRTGAYLAHNSIPIQFTQEDFDQVLSGNFVTKVIYLPDPDFQGPALAGIDTIVSTRLDPGVDPIVEADRRGSILAIIRLGDKDIEMAGTGQGGIGGGMFPNAAAYAGMPLPFAPAMSQGCAPGGMAAGNGNGNPNLPGLPGMVAGVTAPQWGMPMSGTPIGLPGPPHIPLGGPAGLKRHVIKNHTPMHIPQPVNDVRMDIRQAPGMSYPNPVSRIHMTEQNVHPGIPHTRPHADHASQRVY